MDKFLETHKLPTDTRRIRKPKETYNKIESSIKNLPTNKNLRPYSTKHLEELTPIILKLFQEMEEKETVLNSFYEVRDTMIPKPDNDITHTHKRKLYSSIPCK